MKTEFIIRNLFKLPNGITVLACSVENEQISLTGKTATIRADEEVRQVITLLGLRQMLNQSISSTMKGIETNTSVNLSIEEAQSGRWHLSISE